MVPSSPGPALADSPVSVVGAHEFRDRFGYHLARAVAGADTVITRHGRPAARLGPVV